MDSLRRLLHRSRRPSSWRQLSFVSLPQTIFAAPSRGRQRSRQFFSPPTPIYFRSSTAGLTGTGTAALPAATHSLVKSPDPFEVAPASAALDAPTRVRQYRLERSSILLCGSVTAPSDSAHDVDNERYDQNCAENAAADIHVTLRAVL